MKMKMAFWATSFVALSATAAMAEDRVVHVYNWSDYIDESIIANFTKETGIKVVYDTFDTNLRLEAQLLAGGTGYDVVVPTSNFAERQIKAGVFQPLDKAKLPNLVNEWQVIRDKVNTFDPGGQYTVAYTWGTQGIGYNVDKVREILGTDKIESWDVLLNPENAKKFADCGIYFVDAPITVISTVLNYLGLDPLDMSDANLEKAEKALMEIRPYIRKFDSSETINALSDGDICITLSTTGYVLQARDRAREAGRGITIDYVNPIEGGEVWLDVFAIPADAPHVDEAHEFLNYMLRPEVAAAVTNYIKFPNGNAAAREFTDPAIMNDEAVYPAEEVIAKLFVNRGLDPKTERAMNRVYTRVVTGQ